MSDSRSARYTLAIGAVLAGLAVAFGAFGAHALEGRVPEARLATFEIGVRYHMYHALAMLAVGILMLRSPARALLVAVWLFGLGVVLFAGSLYALVLLDVTAFAYVTPVGGVSFIAGWAALVWAVLAR